MHRLTITESIITIALLLGLAFGLHWALRTWLLSMTAATQANMEQAQR